jgi:hypothetical protein
LINYVTADLCQPVNVALARSKITPLYGIVKEAVDRITIILVVLGSVDSTLSGDTVGAARAVLKSETIDVVS